MRARPLAATLLALGLLLGACGRLNEWAGGDGSIDHPTTADELILRVETGGGFVPVEYMLRQVPGFSLFGDGSLVTTGPQIEIYPAPALPNLLVTPITEDGVQAILEAARDAGLLGPDRAYDYPCIMDAGTTKFTLNANGAKHVVSAYALGEGMGGECPGVDAGARGKLLEFWTRLGDFRSWLPQGAIGEERAYEPTALRVYVQPYVPDPNLEQPVVDWPLDTPLASFGDAVSYVPDTRCGVIEGDDLAKLLPEAQRSNELTPWRSNGEEHRLLFRPLLPDERGC